MANKINFVFILIVFTLLISCDFKLLDSDPYHIIDWACIMNSDGSELEYLYEIDEENIYFPNGAKFTQDSQKIIFGSTEGLFTRDFAGNVERISNLKRSEYNFYSSDLEYMYHLENNDIYRMNFDGTDKINITNTPDEVETEANLSNDNQYITYVVEIDTLYRLCKIDINGDILQEIYSTSRIISCPKYNSLNKKVYYFEGFDDLTSVNMIGKTELIAERGSKGNGIKFSIDDNYLFFPKSDSGWKVFSYNILSNVELPIFEPYDFWSYYSADFDGSRVVLGGWHTNAYLYLNDLEQNSLLTVGEGKKPHISPDGEKIFFTKGVSASENIE